MLAHVGPSWPQVDPELDDFFQVFNIIFGVGPFGRPLGPSRVPLWSPKASPRPLDTSPNIPKGPPRRSQRILQGVSQGFEEFRENIEIT